jgi:hypothetical protein
MEQRAGDLAVDEEHVDQPEMFELDPGEPDVSQLAARELDVVSDHTAEVCVGHPLVVPFVARVEARRRGVGQ